MKRKITLLFLIVLIISACAPLSINSVVEEKQTGFTVIDALGREVEFTTYPDNIVIAGKLRPMIVDFLYLFESSADKIAAVEAGGQSSENFIAVIDENIKDKYSLEKGAGAEQIAPLEPDLVILKSSVKESLGDQLELINIPVVYIDFETVDQIYRDIRILGTVLGESERAEELVTQYEDLYTEFNGYVTESDEGKNAVLMQITSPDQEYAYEVPSIDYLQTVMVDDAGGQVQWGEAAQAGGWNEVNLEQINVWNPDFIFIVNYQGIALDIISDLSESQPFGSLKAVKNGQIFAVPFDYISWDQPDPRWILGYSWLVYRLNPQEVGQERMIEMISDFYQFFYRLDESQVEEYIMPRIADYL